MRRAVVLAAVAAALLAAGSLAAVDAAFAARPNVVVVMTDDQDVESMSVMNKTERLLGAAGATFSNFFSTYPLCCPSRATFFTGQYAHNHGVMDNTAPDGGFQAFREGGTLSTVLNSRYRTGYFGKYLNGYPSHAERRPRDIPRGWDHWSGYVGGGMFGYKLNENGRLRRHGTRDRDYLTDELARQSARFISQSARGREPFFLTLAPTAPHTESRGPPAPAPRDQGRFRGRPLPKPPSFNERDVSDKPPFVSNRQRLDRGEVRAITDRHRGRLESLLAVDDAVARVVRTLDRTGELRNTLIVYTSDNGYLQGEHRLKRKTLLYEESVQVPLLVRGPGIPSGVRRTQVTGNIDLAPTILDAARLRPQRSVDGISLMPLAQDPDARQNRDILLENEESAAVRTPRYMYAEHRGGSRELYDLNVDPFQLESRHAAPGFAGIEAALARRLRALEDCSGADCR